MSSLGGVVRVRLYRKKVTLKRLNKNLEVEGSEAETLLAEVSGLWRGALL
jgi:hypothetical protein